MFNEIDVYLNYTKITQSSSNYAYRAYFENLLSFSNEEKESKLKLEGFYAEKQRNSILTKYAKLKRKNFEGYGRIHLDFFHQPRLLLSGCDIRVKIFRSNPEFCIKKDTSITDDLKLLPSIEEIYLNVRRVKLTPHQHLEIERTLVNSAAKYPVTRVEIKSYTVALGVTSVLLNNVVGGKLPNRLIYGLTKHSAYNGRHVEKGFCFQHNSLKSTGVYINGSLYNQSVDTNYSESENTQSLHARAYQTLFTELSDAGELVGITYEEYKDNYCLYAFDLSPDRCVSSIDHSNPVRQGELSINLEFSQSIPENLTLIVYLEHTGLIQVDKTRQVYTDY